MHAAKNNSPLQCFMSLLENLKSCRKLVISFYGSNAQIYTSNLLHIELFFTFRGEEKLSRSGECMHCTILTVV